MAQALRDAVGRELHLVDGYSLDDGILSVDGAPLFLFDDPRRLEPKLLDAIASSIPGATLCVPGAIRPRGPLGSGDANPVR